MPSSWMPSYRHHDSRARHCRRIGPKTANRLQRGTPLVSKYFIGTVVVRIGLIGDERADCWRCCGKFRDLDALVRIIRLCPLGLCLKPDTKPARSIYHDILVGDPTVRLYRSAKRCSQYNSTETRLVGQYAILLHCCCHSRRVRCHSASYRLRYDHTISYG